MHIREHALLMVCECVCVFYLADTFYSCPVVDSDVAGVCSEECSSHADCNGESRCCSNGCGHTCAATTTTVTSGIITPNEMERALLFSIAVVEKV